MAESGESVIIKMKTETEEEKTIEQKEKIKKRQQRENILKSISDKEEFLELEGKQLIYPDQQIAANKIRKAFEDGALAVCLIAQPGTGKTGTAQAFMIDMATNPNDEELIYTENIINCSGMSDNDWETQFKNSVLPAFKDNIFHRQKLHKQLEKLRKLRNGIIISDECHIASGIKMTVAKTFKEAGILDINVLKLRKNIMLDISATPDSVLHDYKKWGNKCATVNLQPGPSYKGFEIMLKEERIIDSPDLEEPENYYKLLEFLDERYKNTTKKYFIFRLLDTAKINILESVCDNLGWNYVYHNSEERVDEIDKLMSTPPEEHTVIIIKNFWTASKRILTKHVGATYEPRPKKQNVSVTAQALTARFCDNYEYSGDQLDINLRPLHYCDKTSIEEYLEWFNKGCDFSTSKYSSKRISSDGKGKIKSKETKVNTKIVENLPDVYLPVIRQKGSAPIISFTITEQEESNFGNDEKMMEIIKKYDDVVYNSYKSYKKRFWRIDTQKKWETYGNAIKKQNAYSSTVNIHENEKTKNLLMTYLDPEEHKIYISPWNGEETK